MKISVEKNVLITHLDDEAALLNIKNGRYFSLNPIGSRIWDLLNQYCDTERVLDILLEEYNAHREVLENDLQNFVTRLVEAELVNIK